MKLDTSALRYLTSEDWRVLTAVEQGSKNHEVVPTPLISQIAGLRGGSGVHKCISNLAKVGLIAKVKNARYDGYRLTYGGLDYLALNTHRNSNTMFSLGNQIGVGKESDIFVCASPASRQLVLKLHRLGRISFRTVKANRDYLRNRSTGSWMYLSRLAAQKEHAFMRVLHREGFPIPEPIAWNRHTIIMEFIDAFPLRMIDSVPEPGKLYAELMDMIVRLASRGLIHGDFNEFNILIKESERPPPVDANATATDNTDSDITLTPILIDFPQTLSTNHTNAQFYFDRDVICIKRYFERRFKYVSDEPGPHFDDAVKQIDPERRLDVEVEATGFSRRMAKDLERYVEVVGGDAEQAASEGEYNDSQEAQEGDQEEDEDDHEDDNVEDNLEVHMDDGDSGDEVQASMSSSKELADNVASLTIDHSRSLESKELGFVPLQLVQDPDVKAERTHAKKKATGWAI